MDVTTYEVCLAQRMHDKWQRSDTSIWGWIVGIRNGGVLPELEDMRHARDMADQITDGNIK